MTDMMLSPAATWVIPTTNSGPVQSMQQNQVCVPEQPQFPSDKRLSRSQKSSSQELVPVMDHAHLEESGCDYPDGSLLPIRGSDKEEAETLMHFELPEEEKGKTETDQDDVKTNDSHHVHDIIDKFESNIAKNDTEDEVEGMLIATHVHEDESFMGGIGRAVKGAGLTVIDGLEKIAHTIRCVLPKSRIDEEQGKGGNIHVQDPSIIGNAVSLGMNIHKVNRGHLVQTVIKGGLAYKANIKDNDVIRKVNDNDVENWEFEKLQEFFGNQRSIEFKLEIERQKGVDENGLPLLITFTVDIKLSFEGDQVVADMDVTYTSWPLSYSGKKPPMPSYFIYQVGSMTSKYLSLDNSFCGMTTKVTENCCFQMFTYKPSVGSPRILYNVGMSRPLDLGKKSRIGDYNGDLTGSGINTANDKRFFYYRKQLTTNMYVFELIARPNYFLTVANGDTNTITETYFPDLKSVTGAGLFNIDQVPSSFKSGPSK